MKVDLIIAEIDAQILRLQQARTLLGGTAAIVRRGPGRPKGSKNSAPATPPRKRKLSIEGRKQIADAMKKRLAERKKQSEKG